MLKRSFSESEEIRADVCNPPTVVSQLILARSICHYVYWTEALDIVFSPLCAY